MRAIFVFVAIIAAVAAANIRSERIVGGVVTSISQYPYIAGILFTADASTYYQICGGSILNTRSILTAAHCITSDPLSRLRTRVGSSLATSGGVVHVLEFIASHEQHDRPPYDNDVAVMRTSLPIAYVDGIVQPAVIAGVSYVIPDSAVVWAVGWGNTAHGGTSSEQLRHAQTWIINQELCTERYTELWYGVTANMICSGLLDLGGRGQCNGDSGGPLVHNGVVIGITAWSHECVHPRYPTVSMRTSRYISWIQSHANL